MSQGIIMVLKLFGGVGLFLYAMKLMGDGLENTAGEKLKSIFEKITSNPIKGVLTGAIVTAVIQSSSATTVMVVGFVNAQLMNLYQATSVIMGANIGTTVTALLVTLDIGTLVPLFIGVGAVMVLFVHGKKSNDIGSIVLGFGLLFFGMDLMKIAMEPLSKSQIFIDMLSKMDGNIPLGIAVGLLITAIVQSSSATTGILISLAGTGVLNISTVVPILFGCNIGTCVTALLASVGTSKTARKAAIIHLMFNVIGTLIFIPLFRPLVWLVSEAPYVSVASVKAQIAFSHIIFNVTNTIILLPFIKYLVKLANKIVKGEDEIEKFGTQFIDDRLLETPVIAVGQTVKEIKAMAEKAEANLERAMSAFLNDDERLVKKVYLYEKEINMLEDDITVFLVKLSKIHLSSNDKEIVMSMFHMVNDIERIGDHATNIAEYASEKIVKKFKLSNVATEELENFFSIVISCVKGSIEAFWTQSEDKVAFVRQCEDKIDSLEKSLREAHVKRLNEGSCSAGIGTMFLDLISNLERIGDHSNNIAGVVQQKFIRHTFKLQED
ncbi:phosphate:Na+ symporter [Hathewaya proteolytica DSM 3090]|uniref:Phosphate:Na+ symporter n=1 Tax=Hathewaya proteolytica DSM 3090 TaxID=1121331 RepID=A0A1M6PY09_9CLOT|nr:Na/Pi cotransporter family protein [Hathewaya proteolytica]SHK12792.1 phosphate:Na+ symporter [Hathewaya proteolytica DSM 3090]